jgi:hypothetical protein
MLGMTGRKPAYLKPLASYTSPFSADFGFLAMNLPPDLVHAGYNWDASAASACPCRQPRPTADRPAARLYQPGRDATTRPDVRLFATEHHVVRVNPTASRATTRLWCRCWHPGMTVDIKAHHQSTARTGAQERTIDMKELKDQGGRGFHGCRGWRPVSLYTRRLA